jgi:hypothetical protein
MMQVLKNEIADTFSTVFFSYLYLTESARMPTFKAQIAGLLRKVN